MGYGRWGGPAGHRGDSRFDPEWNGKPQEGLHRSGTWPDLHLTGTSLAAVLGVWGKGSSWYVITT